MTSNQKCYLIYRQKDNALVKVFATNKGAQDYADNKATEPVFIVEDWR